MRISFHWAILSESDYQHWISESEYFEYNKHKQEKLKLTIDLI